MLLVEDSIIELLVTNSEITDIVGDRVNLLYSAQGTDYPKLIVSFEGEEDFYHSTGTSGVNRKSFTIECWTFNYTTTKELAETVKNYLNQYEGISKGIKIQGIWFLDANDRVATTDRKDDLPLAGVSLRFETVFEVPEEEVGDPPSITSYYWLPWYRRKRQEIIDYCDKPRASTVYFAQAGNDSTGLGTEEAPYKTLAKAQTILNDSGGDIALLFKCGDTWRETTGLDVTKPAVTIGSYSRGGANPPRFTNFTTSLTSGWTLQSGNYYTKTGVTTNPGWIIDEKYFDYAFMAVDSASVCSNTSHSWYWDSGTNTLHINYYFGNPNGASLYSCGITNDDGIYIDTDGCLIDNIMVYGYSCFKASTADYRYGIRLSTGSTGTKTIVVRDCSVYYSGRHNIGAVGTAPSVLLCLRCSAGYMYSSQGKGAYVGYSGNGGNTVIYDSCKVKYGNLPYTGFASGYTESNYDYYGHTVGNGPLVALYIVYNCTVEADAGKAATIPHYTWGSPVITCGDLPSFTDLKDCRGFCVGFKFDSPLKAQYISLATIAYSNCLYRREIGFSSFNFFASTTRGYWYNSIFELTDSRPDLVQGKFIASTQVADATFTNCTFKLNSTPGTFGSFNSFYFTTKTGLKFRNCLFLRNGGRGFYFQNTYTSGAYVNCYGANVNESGDYGIDQGTNTLFGGLVIDPLADPKTTPWETYGTRAIDYDFHWKKRPYGNCTVGAIEANPLW